MKKLISMVMLVLVAITLLASTSSAATATELKDYVCSKKVIGGKEFVIKDADKVKVQNFFKSNEVTDEQATKIKGLLEKAIDVMNADGASTPKELSSTAKKQEVLGYVQEAAAVLGFTVSYDATEERLDIYKDGQLYDSLGWGEQLTQTGFTNYVYAIVAGVVLIAGITLVVARKKIASARA